MTLTALALAFFITALLYSSVGFGGGSTYNALLVLGVADLSTVPIIALSCNILVVVIGSWRFVRQGHVEWRRFAPLAVLSVPFAWLGGYLSVPTWLFVALLALALAVSGLLLLWQPLWRREANDGKISRPLDMVSGATLGLLAGITGIGGGIYLSPLLYLRRWATAKTIAGTCALFILVNSISGLIGQAMKSGGATTEQTLAAHWPLFPAVALGGLVGSNLGSTKLKDSHLRALTGLLILYVAMRLGLRFPGEWASR